MKEVIAIAVAGVLGTLSRYGLSGAIHQWFDTARFPAGTLVVNLLGSFAIGFILQLGLSTSIVPRTFRIAATTGFMGAFTTFSTFSYETVRLIEDKMWLTATLNSGANLLGTLVATWLGIVAAKMISGS